MDKVVELKDGEKVVIRPMRRDDQERSFDFFQSLHAQDRVFLRIDVSKRENVETRIRWMEQGRVKRLVGISNDEIVADGALELEEHDWEEHVGELRLFVSKPYQRRGLGTLMARELYTLASSHKVEEIMVRMMRPQHAARSIFSRLGFKEMVTLPEFVKDQQGNKHDLIVMRCDLEALWRELEDQLLMTDWRRSR